MASYGIRMLIHKAFIGYLGRKFAIQWKKVGWVFVPLKTCVQPLLANFGSVCVRKPPYGQILCTPSILRAAILFKFRSSGLPLHEDAWRALEIVRKAALDGVWVKGLQIFGIICGFSTLPW